MISVLLNDTEPPATYTYIHTLSLHDALPFLRPQGLVLAGTRDGQRGPALGRLRAGYRHARVPAPDRAAELVGGRPSARKGISGSARHPARRGPTPAEAASRRGGAPARRRATGDRADATL